MAFEIPEKKHVCRPVMKKRGRLFNQSCLGTKTALGSSAPEPSFREEKIAADTISLENRQKEAKRGRRRKERGDLLKPRPSRRGAGGFYQALPKKGGGGGGTTRCQAVHRDGPKKSSFRQLRKKRRILQGHLLTVKKHGAKISSVRKEGEEKTICTKKKRGETFTVPGLRAKTCVRSGQRRREKEEKAEVRENARRQKKKTASKRTSSCRKEDHRSS